LKLETAMQNLGIEDFGVILDEDPSYFSEHTKSIINAENFRYRLIQGDELEQLVLRILGRIESDTQIVGAPDRTEAWSRGWGENLKEFSSMSEFSPSALIPKFIRPGQPLRLFSNYIAAEDPWFELNFIRVLRSYLAHKFLHDCPDIHEFGCGTGFNLVDIAGIFPEKRYFGSDFVKSSVDLVREIPLKTNINLEAALFDMKKPNESYPLESHSGVFTFGSLEQLSGNIDPIFDFFIKKGAKIFLHVEPAEELYKTTNLSDWLAHKFQTKRCYTGGLSVKLRALENKGLIEILKIKRCFFGSLFMEGYNIFVWRPKDLA
jgi:SAM-dependent methyltransferase